MIHYWEYLKIASESCDKIWRNIQRLSLSPLYFSGYVLFSVSPVTNWVTCKKERLCNDIAAHFDFHGIALALELFSTSPCPADCPNCACISPALWELCLFSNSTHLGQASAQGCLPLAHAHALVSGVLPDFSLLLFFCTVWAGNAFVWH